MGAQLSTLPPFLSMKGASTSNLPQRSYDTVRVLLHALLPHFSLLISIINQAQRD